LKSEVIVRTSLSASPEAAQSPSEETLKGTRDHAILATLLYRHSRGRVTSCMDDAEA
jgi:hypothetical protein